MPPQLEHQVKRLADGSSPWTDGFDPRGYDGSVFAAIKAHGGMEWSPYYTEVDKTTVAAAHTAGLKVGPWGLSSSADIQRMIALGVFSATVAGPDWA